MGIAIKRHIGRWSLAFSLLVTNAFGQGPGTFAEEAELRAVMAWVRQRTYDHIPSIDMPHLVAAEQASFLRPSDEIVGVEIDGHARAYPLHFLDGREVVNDTLAHTPLAITW